MTESTDTEQASRRRRRLAAAGLYIALAMLLTSRVLEPADDFGDPSFQQSLGYFMAEGLQAGEDYIFTYGPLGHFLIPRYQPGLFWLDFAVGLAMGLLAAWPVFVVLRRVEFGYLERGAVLAAFLLSAHVGPGPETPYLMSAFLTVALIRRGTIRRSGVIGAFAAALAFLSLGKFTLLVLAVGFVGYLALHLAFDRHYRQMAVLIGGYLASVAVFWLAGEQDLGHFARFIADSTEISRAYNAGMFLDGSTSTRVLGAVVVCAALAATLPFLPFDRRRVMGLDAVFVLVYVFILWKSGMVRQNGHEIKLFLPAMILPLLIAAPDVPSPLVRGFRSGAVAIGLAAALAGYVIAAELGLGGILAAPVQKIGMSAYQTVLPWSRLSGLEERWRELGIYGNWPKTEERVGEHSIDIFPPEQRVLLLSELNYRPRYVFQGYQACTPRLLALNGASYWGTGSAPPPDYVLYRSMPIDYRYPYMEDSQALLALFYSYSPVLLEQGLVLFERQENPPEQVPEPLEVAEGVLGAGEVLAVPEASGKWQLLSLEFDDAGQSLVSRGRDYTMAVEYDDGRTAEYRVLPGMTDLPFLLNQSWAEGTPVHANNDYREERIVSLRIIDSGSAERQARYRLLTVEPPAAARSPSETETTPPR